ncbi:MAG: hypothetical protein ACP5MI_07555 [Candidatus Kryptoniota bacterium]
MAKVILVVNYEVEPNKREEYLSLIEELKKGYADSKMAKFEVYEIQGLQNNFMEIYTYNSEEEFRNSDDSQFDDLVGQINSCLKADTVKSHTLRQI